MHRFIENRFRDKNNSIKSVVIIFFATLILVFSSFFIKNNIYSDKEMQISNALKDKDIWRCGWDSGLQRIVNILYPLERLCEVTNFNSKPKQNILLIGNSFADSLKYSLAKIANKHKSSIYITKPNGYPNQKPIIYEALNGDIKNIKGKVNTIILHSSAIEYGGNK